jgi:hypothetical protein
VRNEFMNDMNGQRTGTATRYYGVAQGHQKRWATPT